MKSYRELAVWNKSIDLVEEVYRLIKLLPDDERFSLADQLRRASVSIPSNIAEGHGRSTTKEYLRFLSIAQGSKNEVETQLIICVRLGYLNETRISKALSFCDEIGKMISAITNKLTPKP